MRSGRHPRRRRAALLTVGTSRTDNVRDPPVALGPLPRLIRRRRRHRGAPRSRAFTTSGRGATRAEHARSAGHGRLDVCARNGRRRRHDRRTDHRRTVRRRDARMLPLRGARGRRASSSLHRTNVARARARSREPAKVQIDTSAPATLSFPQSGTKRIAAAIVREYAHSVHDRATECSTRVKPPRRRDRPPPSRPARVETFDSRYPRRRYGLRARGARDGRTIRAMLDDDPRRERAPRR